MTAACQNGQPDFRITIVSEEELIFQDLCNKSYTQKRVNDAAGQSVDESFTFLELKDIAAMLHDSPEFKSKPFERYTHLIVNLGKILVSDDMKRVDLVKAMKEIMKTWLQICKEDPRCLLPPTLVNLKDPNEQKKSTMIRALQEEVQKLLTNEALRLNNPAKLSSEQQQLLDVAAQNALLRKV